MKNISFVEENKTSSFSRVKFVEDVVLSNDDELVITYTLDSTGLSVESVKVQKNDEQVSK